MGQLRFSCLFLGLGWQNTPLTFPRPIMVLRTPLLSHSECSQNEKDIHKKGFADKAILGVSTSRADYMTDYTALGNIEY